MQTPHRIPVLLITGFLGAGKTTLINWLTAHLPELRFSYIVNEFGTIHLESQFITAQKKNIVELANGCMCCVAKSDIPRVVSLIVTNSTTTDLLVIEASGLSEPSPIIEALASGALSRQVVLRSVISVVDVDHFQTDVIKHPLVLAQIADADCVVLSKVRAENHATVKAVEDHIHRLAPLTQIVRWDDTLSGAFFTQLQRNAAMPSTDAHQSEHMHDAYQAVWVTHTVPMNVQNIMTWVAKYSSMLRVKGVVCAENGQKYLLQCVQGKCEWHDAQWADGESHTTALLCISPDLDGVTLQQSFEQLQ